MKVWLLIVLATICNVAIVHWQPLLAQLGDNGPRPLFLIKDDIANVRNVFRTLKLKFEKRSIARIFGPDADGDIITVSVSIKRANSEIERIELVFKTTSGAEKIIELDDKQDHDFKSLADNIKWIEKNYGE